MSSSGTTARRNHEQLQLFVRQATILRKNLFEWDRMLKTPRGENWPTMLGRLNAALNQTVNLDRSIDDVLEHFVYLPKQSTANPQDIPFFLSTRLASEGTTTETTEDEDMTTELVPGKDPVHVLAHYENRAAKLAVEYEENMVRF